MCVGANLHAHGTGFFLSRSERQPSLAVPHDPCRLCFGTLGSLSPSAGCLLAQCAVIGGTHTHSTSGRTSVSFPELARVLTPPTAWRSSVRALLCQQVLHSIANRVWKLLVFGSELVPHSVGFHTHESLRTLPTWYLDRCPSANSLGWMCSSLGWCENLLDRLVLVLHFSVNDKSSLLCQWPLTHLRGVILPSFVEGGRPFLLHRETCWRDSAWARLRYALLFTRCVLGSGLVLVLRLSPEWAVFPSKPSVSVATTPPTPDLLTVQSHSLTWCQIGTEPSAAPECTVFPSST